ncbi:MAG: HAD family hydrolase [Bacillota bacterium]
MLKAVLFDLDGTLLQVNTGEFMAEYLKEISATVAPVIDPARFTLALMASSSAMIANRGPGATNSEVFWADFNSRLKDCIGKVKPLVEEFYEKRFKTLSRVARPVIYSRQAVQSAVGRGLRIALATQPVFPLSAIRERMSWAGVEDLPWDFIGNYEEMHFCKPSQDYYREIAGRLGLKPEECIMVGNDVEEDLVAASIGMKTALVTDYIINANDREYNVDWSGTLAGLAGWFGSPEFPSLIK